MSINRQAVLEYIAQATNRPIRDVERAVNVEYWKDIVDFTSFRGVDLLAIYLESQKVQEIGGGGRLVVLISVSQFQEENSKRTATFCIEEPYSTQFKTKYKDRFKFAAY